MSCGSVTKVSQDGRSFQGVTAVSFRKIQSTRRGQMHKEAPMSYCRASELVKKELKGQGLDLSL